MKKLILCLAMIFGLGNSGCLLSSMLGGAESPRPKEYQVEASKEIVNSNVPVVVGAQTNKQNNIQIVALKALEIIKETTTKEQAEAVTNVAANSFKAIKDADGTKDIIGNMMEKGNDNILAMSTLQYAAYAAGQTAVAMRNQEALYSGIKTGIQWTSGNIAKAGGVMSLAAALFGFGVTSYRKMRNKDRLLKSTGNTINEFVAAEPESGTKLKARLAKATSKLPIDAKTEFGV